MNLRRFYDELKRRHVLRVTGVYLVGVWVVVEVATTVFPLLGWSEGAERLVLIAGIIGLPVVVVLAWLFDLTPEGLHRTVSAIQPPSDAVEAARGRPRSRAIGFVGVGIIIALIGFAAIGRYTGARAPHIQSIAVLPFVDLSQEHNQEYFTEGVTEEIMSRLARVGLRVAARTSSFAFKGQNLEIDEIARRLNVQAVLEGSIRREGDSVRVTVTLIDAATQSVIWGESFDRGVAGIFAIQDEIAGAIVDALKLKLAPETTRPAAGRTRNVAAQELYFKGLKAWHEGTDQQLRAALQFFDQAIAADSTYALAYAGLAKTYAVLPTFGDYPVFDALTKGKQAAAHATALTPNLAEAHAALGQIAQNLEWDLNTALQNYRNALRASPNDATAHQWYAEALVMTGDLATAANEITRALELDPLSAPAKNLRAYQMLLRGDYAAANRLYQILQREHPGFEFGKLNSALAALTARQYGDAAQALVAAFPEFGPDVGVYIAAISDGSDRVEARSIVSRIEATQRPAVAAILYAAIGDRARAVDLLEQAYRTASDASLPYWLLHPLLTPLRSDQRFQEIARGVGITLR
jgi:TolB-like protein/tetratricopeptide (TPR) repeat protein